MEYPRYEEAYADLVHKVLTKGVKRETRNETTRSLFGEMLKVHDLREGNFPLLQGRKMFYKGVFAELAAFFKGPKSIEDFEREGCNYWKQWANEDGSINVDYGNQWIDFNGVNQIDELMHGLITNPYGRRHIISSWRPDRLSKLSLPCCHLLYQFYVTNDGYLDMIWYQRSVDTMVGLPSDVVLAAAMTVIFASEVGLQPGSISMMLGDTHIYEPHVELAEKYVDIVDTLMTYDNCYSYMPLSWTVFNKESIKIHAYVSQPAMKFEVFA